jgi:ATPase family associated with various cellular activities (AAA)
MTPSDNCGKLAPLVFRDLERLRLSLRQLLLDQVTSLKYFEHDVGFQHYKGKKPPKISVASSATCVLSLIATNSWKHDPTRTKELLHALILKNTSAGLPRKNPFTIAWILEAVTVLKDYSDPLTPEDSALVAKMEKILENAVRRGGGGVRIEDYPPSAYLTQLVVRVLDRRSSLPDKLKEKISEWAWAELTRQLTLIRAKTKTADSFAVAYLLILISVVTPSSVITPEQVSTQRAALNTFFECQLEDGTWPLSRPLFHYRKFGNAYCYEYEMLTQLLQRSQLQNLLLEHLPELNSAAMALANNVYRLEDGIRVWTSGHHPQQAKPESWATASVYHFAYELDRLLAEAVRRELFRYLELPLPPRTTRDREAKFAERFLDSTVEIHGEHSLRDFLRREFVEPLADEADGIAAGRQFKKGTPRSAIFFGPPGTSKTELSKEIAKYIGWPFLAVDPSLLLRNGMDGIQAEANTIFRMLEETERVVVLFDEFDEFVRERGSSDAEQFSRLLTTAMLPKLASIHKRATLVFIIATNNIRQFDTAIQRPGRFNRVVQIMPPTFEQKMTKTNWGAAENVDIQERLRTLDVNVTDEMRKALGDLTFLEFDDFATELTKATNAQDAIRTLDDHWERCVLKARLVHGEETTWKERCAAEASYNR